jgi:four helix bundle protein
MNSKQKAVNKMQNSILLKKSDLLAHKVYEITKALPREEVFGLSSQIRRAAISVPLNLIEGYARQSDKDFKRFLLISFGSLKETKYLLNFSLKEKYINQNNYKEVILLADEIGKMLWAFIRSLERKTVK